LVRALAARADVLVENFKVGALNKYGLDYESLAVANPRLVYASITGFGQTGPDAGRAGYDYMIQAVGGLMSITGEENRPPVKVGVAVADLFAGLYASNAVLAALLHARATGEGQHIDIALFEAQAAMLANQASGFFVSGEVPRPLGAAHPNLAPYQPLPTCDGALVVAVGNDGQFQALCAALDAGELAADPRMSTNALRVAHRAELTAALEALTHRKTTRELTRALDAAGVPCGPINRIDQVFAEPQARARELVVEQDRDGQSIRTVASPMRLSRTPVAYAAPPPRLGAHTEAVLGEQLGLTKAEIDRLRAAGVI
jgi:crotonobetainyl-CoA:carnitine CoA-transferase CaiB-like acyl-CoA transferase